MMEPVQTKRLIVRPAVETDLEDFLAYQTHPDILRTAPGEPMTKEHALRLFARQAAVETNDEGGYLLLAIEHRAEAKMIGEVGVFLAPREHKGDVGWILHPDYQGQGYATEAAPVLLAHCFQALTLHRITAGCEARNTASWRLMERLGLRREGHLLQSHFAAGAWHDEYLYALLRDEWRVQQKADTEY